MLCEDHIMSVDNNSPMKLGSGSLDSSASSLEVKAPKYSWAEEVLRAEYNLDDSKSSLGSIDENKIQSTKDSAKPETSANTSANQNVSQDRDISLDFIDSVNEQKFERLVKEDKLKTPFKRRHSNTPSVGSRSNSPISSNSDSCSNADQTTERRNHGYKDEKRVRHSSYTSSSSSSSYTESDPAVLSRRQKQIDYGKNTIAYDRYVEMVPRSSRTRDHPRTPNKYGKYSRRAFDGLVRIWRKQLHYYDVAAGGNPENPNNVESSDDSD